MFNLPSEVMILGTPYQLKFMTEKEEPDFIKLNIQGYCDSDLRLIVIIDTDNSESWEGTPAEKRRYAEKLIIRHEIIHAYFNESGLQDSSIKVEDRGWSKNEEMIDWLAIQGPKIFKTFQELEIL